MVRTFLGGLQNARGIAYAFNFLSSKCVLPGPSSAELLPACGAVSLGYSAQLGTLVQHVHYGKGRVTVKVAI